MTVEDFTRAFSNFPFDCIVIQDWDNDNILNIYSSDGQGRCLGSIDVRDAEARIL